ncbi:MAG: hypothetical protein ACE5GW_01855 [Planctomycetota bacterium]
MRALTDREKRTIRITAMLLAAYLVLFYGIRLWRFLEGTRVEHARLELAAESLSLDLLRELKEERRLRELKEAWRIDLDHLREETVVSAAREAIESSANKHGVGISTSKESQGRAASGDLRVFQLEGSGKTQAVMEFLHSLRSLGYPLVVNRLAIGTKGMKPGEMRLSLNVNVLNFKAWKARS